MVQKNRKKHKFMKSFIFHSSSKTLHRNQSTFSGQNDSKIIQFKKKKQETKTTVSQENEKSQRFSSKSFPCLFVNSLEKKNEVLGTPLANRLIRFLTKKGKKSKAYVLVAKTCTLLAQFEAEKLENEKDFQEDLKKASLLIEQAISNVKPFVEVKKVRVAGTTYQVPAILKKDRQNNFALKWILQSAFERHKKNPSEPLEHSLAFEIYEASQKQGQARVKRNELHKLAENQRAFAHFRWW